MSTNPSALSRRKWREEGYHVETTEFFAQVRGGLPRRQDLFGFVDLVAVHPTKPWVYIQTTSRSNVAARKRKIFNESTGRGQWSIPMAHLARCILAHGDKIVVEGWNKNKAGRWVHRADFITLEDLPDA